MIEPLVVEFAVEATPEHAFATWTDRCRIWWPPAHTVTGNAAAITFEPFPGGRIVEAGADGAAHAWGEVIAWDPPSRLRYWWHLFFDRAEATEVEVTFRAHGSGTMVRIEQRGWEVLGDAGYPRRTRTRQVWETLAPRFVEICEASSPSSGVSPRGTRAGP